MTYNLFQIKQANLEKIHILRRNNNFCLYGV